MLARLALAGLLLLATPPGEVRKTSHHGSVTIRTTSKVGTRGAESVLEFENKNGAKMCQIDYSSADGQHGFGVVKGDFTPDGRFFVWSLQSSGGHSPWHFPTQILDMRTTRVFMLDDFVQGPGISSGEFKLSYPSTVESTAYHKKKVRIQLQAMAKTTPKGSEFHCYGGKAIYLGHDVK